jgi:multidrug efflux system membrane fusion protein
MSVRHPLLWGGGALMVLIALLAGCQKPTPVAETPPPPVSVSQPVVRDVTRFDEYEGRIAAVEMVEVRARARGHLIKVNFEDGQMVTKGHVLFQIDPEPYEAARDAAKAEESSAEARKELAEAEYKRTQKLLRSGAASREEMEVWTAKRATASADKAKALAALKDAELDLGFAKVTAPISGRTSRAQVTVGNLINTGKGESLLTTITSVDPMYVYFDVPERSLLEYRRVFRKAPPPSKGPEPAVKELKIPVEVALEGEEGYSHKGVIDFTDNKVNPSTGTIQVRGVLSNAKRILDSGMRARVRVPIGDPYKGVMVTELAIGTDQGRRFVYVVNAQNVAERREAQLDRLSDGLQVIKSGVKPEDWVIVNGIQRVRDGAKVEPRRVPMPGAAGGKTEKVTGK